MARKLDTGWRDSRLPQVHSWYGFDMPAPGMSLVMVEYDRGRAVGVINYVRRDARELPKGIEVVRAYRAMAGLCRPDGRPLPFLTALYDPRNWTFKLFGHNEAAQGLTGCRGWLPCTEEHFARLLYRLRGAVLPDLSPYGVEFSTAAWQPRDGLLRATGWPGQDLSARRRAYEPEGRVPFGMRNPCSDIDLAVTGLGSGAMNLFVDYKLTTARVDPGHLTYHAMSGVLGPDGRPVPSAIVRYDPGGSRWAFSVLCLNRTARDLVAGALGRSPARTRAVKPEGEWGSLKEDEWLTVLEAARNN